MIGPGSTIGFLGGGQLGRMSAIAARKMGYRIHIFEPAAGCPAGQIADREYNASYEDESKLEEFARSVDVLTLEFENIPVSVLKAIEAYCPIHPGWHVLHTCQNRQREKNFLKASGFPHAPFEVVESTHDLESAVQKIGTPSVLKTADFGYDGKGQIKITEWKGNANEVWQQFDAPRAVLEGWVEYDCEISVICARTSAGEIKTFPVAENIHTNHILDFSIVPARVESSILKAAEELARDITEKLEVVGLLAVELFVTKEGEIIVNELAPRPHNSGHYSFDACMTSQFEQHIRSVCGIPLGDSKLMAPVVMVNLLGDLWEGKEEGEIREPDWNLILKDPKAKLHLYGKKEPRKGRKMGHFCVMRDTVEEAYKVAKEIKTGLLTE